ncbi:MAG: LacI family DNA-binding transcriptional regulator [Ancrocorticia sp.]
MAQRKRPSMSDVARLAGVSTQTVSRVINGEPYVKEAKRESVLEAMRQLHYVPNSAARAMKSGSFKNIGVVYHTLHPVGNRLALEGIVEAAAAQNYRTSLIHWSSLVSESDGQTVMRLGEMSIDAAIVIVSSSSESGAATTRLGRLPVPTVVLGSLVEGEVSSVGIDQASGTEAAVQHLLDLGHTTVHHIAGPALSIHSQSRQRAWQATLEKNSREVAQLARGDWSPTSGYLAAQELLRGEAPTAIFVANDQMALGAYRAVLEAGLRIPQDISIIGCDDIDEACQFPTPLTTINQHWDRAGHETLSVALDMLSTGSPSTVSIPTELVVRESTAPPRS